jgi:hypothetical protein
VARRTALRPGQPPAAERRPRQRAQRDRRGSGRLHRIRHFPASTALTEVFGELPELRDAMNLAWRVLVLWLAVIALFVVAGWVG